jgi:hypothetical protein
MEPVRFRTLRKERLPMWGEMLPCRGVFGSAESQGGDTLSALAARDAQPVAEERAGGPVATKNT